MIIRCDNCSVSLQVDESKIPAATFTVRCPRCQNLVRAEAGSNGSSTVNQLKSTSAAPPVEDPNQEPADRRSDSEINKTLRALFTALQGDGKVASKDDEDDNEKSGGRRVLLCLGKDSHHVSTVLVRSGFKVYLAETPAQANERLRDGKTEVVLLSPDFAEEFGGAAILQQKVNAMFASERRRLYLVMIEEGGQTLNAH